MIVSADEPLQDQFLQMWLEEGHDLGVVGLSQAPQVFYPSIVVESPWKL